MITRQSIKKVDIGFSLFRLKYSCSSLQVRSLGRGRKGRGTQAIIWDGGLRQLFGAGDSDNYLVSVRASYKLTK